jgi:hypothetical protein
VIAAFVRACGGLPHQQPDVFGAVAVGNHYLADHRLVQQFVQCKFALGTSSSSLADRPRGAIDQPCNVTMSEMGFCVSVVSVVPRLSAIAPANKNEPHQARL